MICTCGLSLNFFNILSTVIAGWVPPEDRWAILKEHPKWEGHPDYVDLYRLEGEPKR